MRPGQCTQLGYKVCRIRIGTLAALGALVNHLVQVQRGAELIIHHIQPGGGLGHRIGQARQCPTPCRLA